MSWRFESSVTSSGRERADPDIIYYNCDIINNFSADTNVSGLAQLDPPIRFNETRDTALLRDASKYHFSIVRFTMDGPNRTLPLLIPTIQLGQTDVNLTTYALALTLQQTWNISTGQVVFSLTPPVTFMKWIPECQNPIVAPTPPPPLVTQDITSRYYYCTTYQWMVNLINTTFLTAQQTLYALFKQSWTDQVPTYATTDPFPYPTFASFQGAVCNSPWMVYNPTTQLFSIYLDSRAFGVPVIPFTPVPYTANKPGPQTPPVSRMFMNTNLYGLFANFPCIYWNTTAALSSLVVANNPLPTFGASTPVGYTYEITTANNFYQNVVDYRQAPWGGATPIVPTVLQQPYYVITQDYPSTDSIWSPIASIVFTTSLVPVRTEQVAAPTLLGTSNIGNSAPTSASAFAPIITDIALDTTVGGAAAWKSFTYYAPTGEYRMSDLTSSKTDIQSIDVQVYWKNRLDGNLYPVSMYNLSNVSFKMMFRRKDVGHTKGNV